MKCNVFMVGFVKKIFKKFYVVFVDRLKIKVEIVSNKFGN